MMRKLLLIFTTFLGATYFDITANAQQDTKEIKIGVIVSLSGVAAAYGQAVLNGIQLAVDQSAMTHRIKLVIEDDQSLPKNVSTIYQKLRSVDRIDALLAGSWWVNSIVKTVERDGIPFISCETLYNKDFVTGKNYFSLGGDLRQWITVYEPLIERNNWRSIQMIKFVSGFADTLRDELKNLFSGSGRQYIPEIEYSDLEMSNAATFAIKTRSSNADVIYVDAQPESFAYFVNHFSKLGNNKVAILTTSVADTAFHQKLIDPEQINTDIYFLRRSSYTQDFILKFRNKFNKEPVLNSDLGYYALLLVIKALASPESPISALKQGITVAGLRFSFDENNVSHIIKQEIFTFQEGVPVKIKLTDRQ